jgi:hypothetical protein
MKTLAGQELATWSPLKRKGKAIRRALEALVLGTKWKWHSNHPFKSFQWRH